MAKVITRVVISIATLEIIEKESHEYDGPWAYCGSGGGGGGSGEVSWPTYLEETHEAWLTGGSINYAVNIQSAMEMAYASLPYSRADNQPYNPSEEGEHIEQVALAYYNWSNTLSALRDMQDYIGQGITFFERALDPYSVYLEPEWSTIQDIKDDWTTPEPIADEEIGDNLAADTKIAAAVEAYGDNIDDQILTDVIPRFEAGMRDINAVMSSAFVLGRSIIEGMRDRDVDKFQADLYYKAFLQKDEYLGRAYLQNDEILARDIGDKNKTLAQAYISEEKNNLDYIKTQNLITAEMGRHKTSLTFQMANSIYESWFPIFEHVQAACQYQIEAARIRYVMYKEYHDRCIEHGALEAKWPLDVMQPGANMLAAISGGTGYAPNATPGQSVLGGALAGASIGARVSGGKPIGAGIGAILGGIGGYLLGSGK